MDELIIETAKKNDINELKPLLLELISSIEDASKFNVETALENCKQIIQHPNSYIYIARMSKKVVGFINFTIRKTILHKAPSGLIDEIVVAKIHHKQGIGKKLIAAAIEKCTKLGCCEVEVSTEITNKAAISFYKNCGFRGGSVLLEYDID